MVFPSPSVAGGCPAYRDSCGACAAHNPGPKALPGEALPDTALIVPAFRAEGKYQIKALCLWCAFGRRACADKRQQFRPLRPWIPIQMRTLSP